MTAKIKNFLFTTFWQAAIFVLAPVRIRCEGHHINRFLAKSVIGNSHIEWRSFAIFIMLKYVLENLLKMINGQRLPQVIIQNTPKINLLWYWLWSDVRRLPMSAGTLFDTFVPGKLPIFSFIINKFIISNFLLHNPVHKVSYKCVFLGEMTCRADIGILVEE